MKSEGTLVAILRYLRKVTLIVSAIAIGAAISFVFTGGPSFLAYSDRLFWGGIAAISVAGFGVMSLMGINRSVNLPDVIVKPEHARILMDKHLEIRARIEKRYDFCILFFVVGWVCIGFSAAIQILASGS